jgi:hypothetical protein
MNSKIVLSVLFACGLSVSAGAAEPASSTLLKQCESAQGEVKEECRDVAKEMLRNENKSTSDRDDKTSQDVTHSSPAMTSPQEAKREAKKPAPAPKKEPAAPKPAPDPSN